MRVAVIVGVLEINRKKKIVPVRRAIVMVTIFVKDPPYDHDRPMPKIKRNERK